MAISNAPWDGSAGKYPTAAAYAKASLINLNTGPSSSWTKSKVFLPVREPNGDINRNGVHAAAAVLAGSRGGVNVPPAAKKMAARKLVGLYGQLKETPPPSIKQLAS